MDQSIGWQNRQMENVCAIVDKLFSSSSASIQTRTICDGFFCSAPKRITHCQSLHPYVRRSWHRRPCISNHSLATIDALVVLGVLQLWVTVRRMFCWNGSWDAPPASGCCVNIGENYARAAAAAATFVYHYSCCCCCLWSLLCKGKHWLVRSRRRICVNGRLHP